MPMGELTGSKLAGALPSHHLKMAHGRVALALSPA